jgi:hypothetical protein
MDRLVLVAGILSLALSAVIFILADGLRRWYSGGFFALIGIVMLVNHFRWRRNREKRV